jgi:predicted amidohydrolase
MSSAIVAALQPQWKRFTSQAALRDYMIRFLRLARDKKADIALFPELTGLLLTGPLAHDHQESLQRSGGILSRIFGRGAEANLAEAMPTLVSEFGDELNSRYIEFFGALAAEYRMMIVAGTLLTKDERGSLRSRAGVFDADGSLLGWQNKLHLDEDEQATIEPGDKLATFESAIGPVGVLIGHDLLFPELARALAYQGCVGILCPTLARSRDSWQRQRLVASARAQENQIFVALSYMVGENEAYVGPRGPLVGRSSVLSPVELSSRGDSTLAEVGAEKVEGVVTGEWNAEALRNLWHSAEVRVREIGRGELFQDLLGADYQSGTTIADRAAEISPALDTGRFDTASPETATFYTSATDTAEYDRAALETGEYDRASLDTAAYESAGRETEALDRGRPEDAEADADDWYPEPSTTLPIAQPAVADLPPPEEERREPEAARADLDPFWDEPEAEQDEVTAWRREPEAEPARDDSPSTIGVYSAPEDEGEATEAHTIEPLDELPPLYEDELDGEGTPPARSRPLFDPETGAYLGEEPPDRDGERR